MLSLACAYAAPDSKSHAWTALHPAHRARMQGNRGQAVVACTRARLASKRANSQLPSNPVVALVLWCYAPPGRGSAIPCAPCCDVGGANSTSFASLTRVAVCMGLALDACMRSGFSQQHQPCPPFGNACACKMVL